MSVDQLEAAQAAAAEFKGKASQASADLLRASKELGAAHGAIESLSAENAHLSSYVAELEGEVAHLKRLLGAADAEAAKNAPKVAAAKQIAEALKAL